MQIIIFLIQWAPEELIRLKLHTLGHGWASNLGRASADCGSARGHRVISHRAARGTIELNRTCFCTHRHLATPAGRSGTCSFQSKSHMKGPPPTLLYVSRARVSSVEKKQLAPRVPEENGGHAPFSPESRERVSRMTMAAVADDRPFWMKVEFAYAKPSKFFQINK